MEDKYLVCKDCGNEFLFSASEQEFYAEKGFENEPGRCPSCRKARKQQRNGFGNSRGREDRQMFRPSVLLVVKRLQYHSSLPVTDLFIAETVSKLEGTVATDKLLK